MSDVEISEVTAHHVEGPRPWAFVEVTTDTGITGIGEVPSHTSHPGVRGTEVIEQVGSVLIGADPFETEALFGAGGRMGAASNDIFTTRISGGFDMACWDIKGKHLGVPVYELLGGKVRDTVRAYANGWDFPARDIVDRYHAGEEPDSVLADTKQEITTAAADVVDAGYTALKFSPFQWNDGATTSKHELDLALEVIEAVHETVPESVELLIEGHRHLTPDKAMRVSRQLERFDPGFYEEPVEANIAPLESVAQHSRVPIATGEGFTTHHVFAEVLRNTDVSVLQPDIGGVGGITELEKLVDLAASKRVALAPHNASGPVMTVAGIHVDVIAPTFMIQETFEECFHPEWSRNLLRQPLEIEDGYIRVPERPGLGIEFDREVLREHRIDDDD